MSTPFHRKTMFRRGFGDGARCVAMRFAGDADYEAGYEVGRFAAIDAVAEFCEREKLPPPKVLRAVW